LLNRFATTDAIPHVPGVRVDPAARLARCAANEE
jgi:hypothetical protein